MSDNIFRSGSTEDKLDPTPVEMPIGYKVPTSLEQMIAKMIRQERMDEIEDELETFEEANDFTPDEPEDLPDFSAYTLTEAQYEEPTDWYGSGDSQTEEPESNGTEEQPPPQTGDRPDPDDEEPPTQP